MIEELKAKFKDVRYGMRYLAFIERFTVPETMLHEKHHIMPRSMFPEYADSPWNIVRLTPKAHYIAHYMLWRAVKNRSTLYAFNLMRRASGNSSLYQAGKVEYREYVRNMRWYYDVDTGKHVYTDGEPPIGYVSGYAFDTTPRRSLWAYDPDTGKSSRFETAGDIPGTFIAGRGKGGYTKHLNAGGTSRFLNLKTKRYEIVDDGAKQWFHVPMHGRRIDGFTVLIRDGVHHLTLASLPEHLKPLLKKGDGVIVPKPHWNASVDANEFRRAHHGKTYKESGISVVNLQHCDFNEQTEIRY